MITFIILSVRVPVPVEGGCIRSDMLVGMLYVIKLKSARLITFDFKVEGR